MTDELIDVRLEEEAVQLNMPYEEVEAYSQQDAQQHGLSTISVLTWSDEEPFE